MKTKSNRSHNTPSKGKKRWLSRTGYLYDDIEVKILAKPDDWYRLFEVFEENKDEIANLSVQPFSILPLYRFRSGQRKR